MNRRDYDIFEAGRQAAQDGGGLSDSPYGGMDGHTWRRGVQAALDADHQDHQDHQEHAHGPATSTPPPTPAAGG
jgi:hypothetical protein